MATSVKPAERFFRKIFPAYRHRWEIYNELLRKNINNETVWLDVGCGNNEYVSDYGSNAKDALGIDIIDYDNRENAPFLKSDIRKIPLPSAYANFITLRMVAEHLERIPEDLSEVDRLLAPGGILVILTTNIWSPLIFLPRLLSFRLKKWLILKFFGAESDEVFPTYHRFNSYHKIKNGVYNLQLKSIEYFEQVSFHSNLLAVTLGLLYAVLNLGMFRFFRSNILAVFEKLPEKS